jgi:CBS domain containing-hemolysin-like protein
MLAEMEDASAALQDEEREMIRGVMELEFTLVREVMVPRPDIVSVEVNLSFDEAASALVERGFSRLPVYEGDIDHILGIIHAKEVLRHLTNGNQRPTLRDIVREVHVVPESKKVHELLSEMKDLQISIAIVVDEYGGTAGLVTVEDLVEEIVGEIRDEYDVEEQPIEQLNEAEAIVDGRVGIDELNEMFEAQIQKEDFDSVGGFIVNELGRMPSVGDTVRFNGISLKVLTVAGRRIKKVLVTRAAHESED